MYRLLNVLSNTCIIYPYKCSYKCGRYRFREIDTGRSIFITNCWHFCRQTGGAGNQTADPPIRGKQFFFLSHSWPKAQFICSWTVLYQTGGSLVFIAGCLSSGCVFSSSAQWKENSVVITEY